MGGGDPRQGHHHDRTGQKEQGARRDGAPDPMQPPADIGRQLLRLGPRQQHGIVQAAQECLLVDPAFAVDAVGLHDRDLTRRAAERDEAQMQPIARGFGKAYGVRVIGGGGGRRCGFSVHDNPFRQAAAWNRLVPGRPASGQSLDGKSV